MKLTIDFSKYHGCGNDFILIDGISQNVSQYQWQRLAPKLCSRHFGIGADGVILVEPSHKADIKMTVINSDGSMPQMCGNGLRCFAKFVFDQEIITKDVFSVETPAGIMIPELTVTDAGITTVEVDMGEPILQAKKIPVALDSLDPCLNYPLKVGAHLYHINCVSMGNPHAVMFVDQVSDVQLAQVGPLFSEHPFFPEGINTEFAQVITRQEVIMKVWERGAGETLACGTGACAVVTAGVLQGKLDRQCLVHLPGGDLMIDWNEETGHVIMTGPAVHVFDGQCDITLNSDDV